MDKLSNFLIRYGKYAAVIVILSALIPISWLPKAKVDNSIEVWIGRHSKEYSQYSSFLNRFGNEEFVIIACQSLDPLDEEALELQRTISEKLQNIDNVDMVLAPCSLADGLAKLQSNWKEFIVESELPNNLIYSLENHTFGIIVWLNKIETPALRKSTIENIEAVVKGNMPTGGKYYLAGTPFMNVALDRGSQQASRTFLPIAFFVSLVFLIVSIRNISGIIAILCSVGVTTIWTVGLFIISGKTFNMVTVILPSLLCVLSLAGGIHITLRFISLYSEHRSRKIAMQKTLVEVSMPIIVSSVTTAVGFSSLMISDMEPVIDFGIFAAIGIILSFCINLLVVSGLLLLLPLKTSNIKAASTHWTSHVSAIMSKHKLKVASVSVILLLLCINLTARARIESNVLKFFPEDSKISRDYSFIGDNLTGLYTVEIEFVTPSQKVRQTLKELEQISGQLSVEPQVAKVLHSGSIASFIKSIHYPALLSSDKIRENPAYDLLDRYNISSQDQTHLRMSVFVRAMDSNKYDALINSIHLLADDNLSTETRYTVTGIVPLLNAAQQSLISTQIKSFGLALVIVLFLIGTFMKSMKAVLAAFIPNVLPIFVLFSIMALTHIPIDAATVMIASVAIGIAVDDTIHFLTHFKIHRNNNEAIIPAIQKTFYEIGSAVTLTSIIAASGFFILYFSQFKPIRYFGILAAITMFTAWLGDVLILPACVTILNLWNKQSKGNSINE
ncbi:MAG: MMPL family transporter [Sedimentisphaerales bacterium]|nr:MMPL family transporter [Sedimentisphaerales bacterium]